MPSFADAVEGDGDGGGAAVDGGVSEDVVDDWKQAFGTDFNVDDRLIQAILRGNCIAFVGAGFSQNETKMTWDDLIQELLVMFEKKVRGLGFKF